MAVSIRPFEPADAEAVFHLRVNTFTSAASVPFDENEQYVPDDRRLVAVDGDTVVGHLGIWPLAQAYGGRPVQTGGVASVIVAATHRGRGVARGLLEQALDRMRELGDVASTLYPATVIPYRRSGWEIAGVRMRRTVPTRLLRELPRPARQIELRPAIDEDLPAIGLVHNDAMVSRPGGLVASDVWLRRSLVPDPDDGDELHVAVAGDEVVGVLHHERVRAPDPQSAYAIKVHQLVGRDGDVELALWRFVGSYASMALETQFISRPDEPLLHLLDEIDVREVPYPEHWMTRLVDASGAIAARGFPPGMRARVPLSIRDPQVPANDGAFVLEIENGKGQLTPGGDGRVELDIGGFAALFTGFTPAAALAHRGRLRGASAADLEALGWAFGGPTPWLNDYF